ncbi:MAG: DUF4105 domain-containing protein, partial [bacterium]|nr:DUF4105 domain-containing protein [bacterium]
GNPASTFGHALLKLNTDSTDDESGLFDLVLNYGAVVPENEATSTYVLRGLFGGYEAGFSDKYFYTQDLVYTRTEFRDIWDYKLNLSDDQRILLVFHIWEIIGKKFTYYFLDKNCAYRLAELIELATDEELLDHAHLWYIPVEMFHRLKAVDKVRRESGDAGLIQSVRFIPSSQRVLYHQLGQLLPQEIKAANTIIKEGHAAMPGHVKAFMPDRQIEILDALLAYHQYQLVAEEPTPDIGRRKAKDQILLERLRLPARIEPRPEVPELNSPAQGSRPMAIGIGVARDWDGESYWRAQWAPFSQELVGLNSLEGSELAVLDLIVGLKDEGNAFIDQLDFVRVRKLNTAPVAVVGERQWAWQLRATTRRTGHDEEGSRDTFIRFGAGISREWKKMFVIYAMTDVAGHRLSPHARLRPHIGISARMGALGAWGYVGAETTNSGAEFRDVWGGKLQYHLSSQQAFRVQVSNENNARTSISFISYW